MFGILGGVCFLVVNLLLVRILENSETIDILFISALIATFLGNLCLVLSGAFTLVPMLNLVISMANVGHGFILNKKD